MDVDHRADDEPTPVQRSLSIAAPEHLTSDPANEHVGPPTHERREVGHERADVEQRARVQEDVARVDPRPRPISLALRDERPRRQHRGVRPFRRTRRVDQEKRKRMTDVIVGIGDRRAALRGPTRHIRRCRDRSTARSCSVAAARPACTVSPTSSRCHTITLGARSSITKASSAGCCRQFAGQNIRADLAAREEHFLQAERVLSQPEHAIALTSPGRPAVRVRRGSRVRSRRAT